MTQLGSSTNPRESLKKIGSRKFETYFGLKILHESHQYNDKSKHLKGRFEEMCRRRKFAIFYHIKGFKAYCSTRWA